jgi:hypothetical protein
MKGKEEVKAINAGFASVALWVNLRYYLVWSAMAEPAKGTTGQK